MGSRQANTSTGRFEVAGLIACELHSELLLMWWLLNGEMRRRRGHSLVASITVPWRVSSTGVVVQYICGYRGVI